MREMVNQFFETAKMPDFSNKNEDPFWDEPEPILIGTSYQNLEFLSYVCENEEKRAIFSMNSTSADAIAGFLQVAYWPCTYDGDEKNLPEDLLVDDPEQLLGKEMFFKIKISQATGLPLDTCKNTFVTYGFKYEPDIFYRTEEVVGTNPDPLFAYE